MAAKGPFRVAAVNASAENSKALVELVSNEVKDQYNIEYVGNLSTIEEVKAQAADLKPDILFIASSFDPEQSAKIKSTADTAYPDVKVSIIPHGLQAEKGPQGVVAWAKEQLPILLG